MFYFGPIGWLIWHWYWDLHAPKKTSLPLFRWLHNWIAQRKGAIIMTSLAVTLGFLGVFSRILDIGTALSTTIIFALLESIWIIGIFTKNKLTKRRMITSKGPTPVIYITYLIVAMGAIGFFFSVLNYGATQLSFIVIMIPTGFFCFIAYKIFSKIRR